MSRRVALAAPGVALLMSAARAQSPARPLRIAPLPDARGGFAALADALRAYGRVEGRDYVLHRSGVFYGEDTERALQLAIESRPDLIVTYNLGYAIAAHRRTKTIPIVMQISGFPVEGGVALSLARPGSNVTGLSIYAGTQVFGKLVQLLVETRPAMRRVGAFCSYVPPFNPAEEAVPIIEEIREAGRRLGIDLRVFEIARSGQVSDALAAVGAERLEGLLLTSGVSTAMRMQEVLRFAVDRRLPTVKDMPTSGELQPLLTYGPVLPELVKQAAGYIDRILWQGASPADLPIQLPSKFELVANLKTARAIGLVLPQSLLLRADRVVQ